MNKIHMNRKGNSLGWTKCHKGRDVKRTNRWEKVTCKNCLKYRGKPE